MNVRYASTTLVGSPAPLTTKPPFGADRNDHGVLDGLASS
jgi:hypothetical protein